MRLYTKRSISLILLVIVTIIAWTIPAIYKLKEDFWKRDISEVYPLFEQGRYQEVIQKLKVVVRDDPTYYDAHCYLAASLHKLGRYEEAIKHYKIASKLRPTDALPHISAASVYLDAGDFDAHIRELRYAIKAEPRSAVAHTALGRALAHIEDLIGAEKHFKIALAIAPNNPPSARGMNTYHELAQVYMQEGDYAKAEDVLNRCLEETMKDEQTTRQPSIVENESAAVTFLMFGLINMEQKHLNKAIENFKKAISISPNLSLAHYKLGVAYLRIEQKGKALRELEKAVRLAPNKPDTHHSLGQLLISLGDETRGKKQLAIFEELKAEHDKRTQEARKARQKRQMQNRATRRNIALSQSTMPEPDGKSSIDIASLERSKTSDSYSPPSPPTQTLSSEIRFVDVTRDAGINVKHFNGVTAKKYMVETFSGGGGFLDYDNDGNLDLYVVNGAPLMDGAKADSSPQNILLRSNGDGTFTNVTDAAHVGDRKYGFGCAFGDYDNDGDVDIYVTNFGRNVLYQNNGDGTFSDVSKIAGISDQRWGTSCTFLDYDRDGFLDLFIVNYVDFQLEKNIECRIGDVLIYCHPKEYDGIPDILYRNNGDGTFTDVTEEANISDPNGKGLGVVTLDYDNDGDSDIYVANDVTANNLYRNNGDGTFTDVGLLSGVAYNDEGTAQAGMGTDSGDYNNDGLIDLIVINFDNEANALYRNDGNGMFTDASSISGVGPVSFFHLGFGTGFFDYDNDGWQDIFVANGHVRDNVAIFSPGAEYAQKNMVLRNNKDGTFTNITDALGKAMQIKRVSRASCFGDYDRDGDLDIFIVNLNQHCQLLRNDGGNRKNWLIIRCIGRLSNRDAVGTKIKIRCANFIQVREIKSGSSYLSQNASPAHFGLGQNDRADSIEIMWPSGRKQKLTNVNANQYLLIVERKYNL